LVSAYFPVTLLVFKFFTVGLLISTAMKSTEVAELLNLPLTGGVDSEDHSYC